MGTVTSTDRLHTPVCALLGIDVPIVGAGMGGLAGPALAAAISEAGGLGIVGAGGDEAGVVSARLREARRRTSRPLGVGTRCVAAEEAFAHDEYRRRVTEADETESVLTDVYEIGWPGRPHWVLRNSTIALWEAEPEPRARPGDRQPQIVARRRRHGAVEELPRFWVDSPTADVEEGAEAMALYAGPSAGLVQEVLPAAEIVRRIAAEAQRVLDGLTHDTHETHDTGGGPA